MVLPTGSRRFIGGMKDEACGRVRSIGAAPRPAKGEPEVATILRVIPSAPDGRVATSSAASFESSFGRAPAQLAVQQGALCSDFPRPTYQFGLVNKPRHACVIAMPRSSLQGLGWESRRFTLWLGIEAVRIVVGKSVGVLSAGRPVRYVVTGGYKSAAWPAGRLGLLVDMDWTTVQHNGSSKRSG